MVVAPESLRPNEGYNDYEVFYRPVAENLIEGKGYVNDRGVPELHNPPGYPLILAGVFAAARLIGISQSTALTWSTVLTVAGCAVLIFLIAREFMSQGWAVISALLYITYPITLVVASYRFSEAPFSLVLYLAVLVMVRAMRPGRRTGWWLLAVGGLVGYAALIRPAAFGLILAFVVALWSWGYGGRRRRLGHVGIVLVGTLIVILPWEAWVLARTDKVVLLSTAGKDSVVDGLTVTFRPEDESGTLALPGDLKRFMGDAAQQQESFRSMSDIARFLARAARERPLAVIELGLFKAVRAWYGTNALKWENLILAVQIPYLTLLATGLVMGLRREGQPRRIAKLVLLCVLYSWVVAMAALPIVRLMSPVLGLMFPFGSLALASLAASATARWAVPPMSCPR
jgi:4-amino-4-deoxy-L-arabinose transferase-like glycosyltransferase